MSTPPKAVEQASRLGHDVEWERNPATRVDRWICKVCGLAVSSFQGNVYGPAVEQPCPGTPDVERA